ncbi:hypothetical protein PROFUN_14874 [Planoprotostelium fungivorum]|uniref:Uncharacterized protein n=1 Tax=Planoprotostelium fungivorum TaxID=1890364 RepID=A0A2P6MSB4_9EUKA|nr:hypothetical protein PROFUN_14874 [Planoprotostelium fungivorum]
MSLHQLNEEEGRLWREVVGKRRPVKELTRRKRKLSCLAAKTWRGPYSQGQRKWITNPAKAFRRSRAEQTTIYGVQEDVRDGNSQLVRSTERHWQRDTLSGVVGLHEGFHVTSKVDKISGLSAKPKKIIQSSYRGLYDEGRAAMYGGWHFFFLVFSGLSFVSGLYQNYCVSLTVINAKRANFKAPPFDPKDQEDEKDPYQGARIKLSLYMSGVVGLAHLLTIVLLREYRRVLDLVAVCVAKRLRTLIYSIESYSTMRRFLDIPNAIILCMSAVES